MLKRNLIRLTLVLGFISSTTMAASLPSGMWSIPLTTINQGPGRAVTLGSFKGKVMLVDFWASWCGPCRISFPFYQKLQDQYGSQGLVIVGVNGEEDMGAVNKFYQEYGTTFLLVRDIGNALAHQMNPPKMPTSYLFDRNGNLVHEHDGFYPGDDAKIEEQVKTLLGQPGGPSNKGSTEARQNHKKSGSKHKRAESDNE
jgi:cytochrome c biogenesis protein CcmG/thiol:disulfide interchange protein DsbE